MRRGIVLLGVALAALSSVPAHASATSMSYTTRTSAAGVVLPVSTVSADEVTFAKGKATGARTTALHVSGSNAPGTESVVAAVWRGTVRAGRDGAVVDLAVDSAHVPVSAASGSDVTVERQVRGRWVDCLSGDVARLRAVELTSRGTNERFSEHCQGVRNGSAVPVRVTFVLTYDDATASVDDTLSVSALVV